MRFLKKRFDAIRYAFAAAGSSSEATAAANKIIWIEQRTITQKVFGEKAQNLCGVRGGDWDLGVTPITTSIKYRSVVEHFERGIPWDATEIFGTVYVRRLKREGRVLGCSTMSELIRRYETQIDALFHDMKDNGFVIILDKQGQAIDLPHVHIGREGDVLYGTRGNHRLAIAHVLGLEYIPCQVRTRHESWQRLRERLANMAPRRRTGLLAPELVGHPDLLDLLGCAPLVPTKARQK